MGLLVSCSGPGWSDRRFPSESRADVAAAKAFFRKALRTQGRAPISITLDGYAASHRAAREMSAENRALKDTKL